MLRFNFAEVKESAVSKFIKPDVIFLLLVIAGALGVILYEKASLEEELRVINGQIVKLQKERERLIKVKRKEKELTELRKKLKEKLAVVSNLQKGRQVPPELYFFGNPENVRDIWLDSLKIKPLKKVEVKGNLWDIKELPDFLKRVEEEIGTVVFQRSKRVEYENEKLKLNFVYYQFNFTAERKNGSHQ